MVGAFVALMPIPAADPPLSGWRGLMGLVLLLAIGASDLVDGYLARKHGLTSRVGVVLDAVADKIAQLGVAAYFVVSTLLPGWFLVLLVARDVVMGVGTWAVARLVPGVPLRHRMHGKAASVLVFVLFVWTLLGALEASRRWMLLVTAGVVTVSTAAYVAEGVERVRDRRR